MKSQTFAVLLRNDPSANTVIVSVYRLNTYPLINYGFLYATFNAVALIPLLERFEAEHGTLLTAAMFVGRACYLLPQSARKFMN